MDSGKSFVFLEFLVVCELMLLYLRKAATGKRGDRYTRVKGTQGKVPDGLIRMKNRVTHKGHDSKSINSNITDFF